MPEDDFSCSRPSSSRGLNLCGVCHHMWLWHRPRSLSGKYLFQPLSNPVLARRSEREGCTMIKLNLRINKNKSESHSHCLKQLPFTSGPCGLRLFLDKERETAALWERCNTRLRKKKKSHYLSPEKLMFFPFSLLRCVFPLFFPRQSVEKSRWQQAAGSAEAPRSCHRRSQIVDELERDTMQAQAGPSSHAGTVN